METKNKAERNTEPKKRSIILPTWLWDLLDADADRCLRSTTKQMEAFLTLVYDPKADLEINKEPIEAAFHSVSQKRKAA